MGSAYYIPQKDRLELYHDLPDHIFTAIDELQEINTTGYTVTIEYPFLFAAGIIITILNLQTVPKDITEFQTGACGK
jgi:hypothetical protein